MNSRVRSLGSLRLAAAELFHSGVEMRLDDGGGYGWVLVGECQIDGVGSVIFECVADPDDPTCFVHVRESLDATSSADIYAIASHFGKVSSDILDARDG